MKSLTKFSRIFLDTNCFIYLFEQHPQYYQICQEIFNFSEHEGIKLITSIITLAEILVAPLDKNDQDLAKLYTTVLQTELDLLDLDWRTALSAAQLKSKYKIRLPDALQLAAAISAKADVFITNDHKLKKIREIKILDLDSLV